ncbi:MAG TPA: M23 family metallopeptidase [Gemmatimonadales bacterium]|nr:M23 family metallopeptidase [Gemmatimonadales bacterium]
MHQRRERWTIMLVPESSSPTRAIALSSSVAKLLVVIGWGAAVGIVALGVAAVARGLNVTRNMRLEHEHRVLMGEVDRLQAHLAALQDTIVRQGERDQQLRLMADLPVLDSAVQAGGIGGPPGNWPERDTLLALGPDGRRALTARMDVDALGRRTRILLRSMTEAYDSLSSHVARFAATPSILPANGRISSPFSAERFDPVLGIVRPHRGMDVAAPMGSTIEAAAAGVVTGVKWEEGFGNYVTIDHGYGVQTRYAHCLRILVTRGQRVTRGQPIALVGSTGESTGPHVHYEVWVHGKPVDPKAFVLPDVITD